jgi:hypothetical protein
VTKRVTIVAPFRSCADRVGPFRERVEALDYDRECVRVVCVEGDSTDDTWAQLQRWARQDCRVKALAYDTGKPHYGSVVNAERFALLADVFNVGMACVDRQWSDYALMLPSDIEYGPEMLGKLIAHGVDVVAPLVFMGGRFYDVWAFTRDGRGLPAFRCEQVGEVFRKWAVDSRLRGKDITRDGLPARPMEEGGLVEMDTVGGTMLVDVRVLRAGVRYRTEDVDRGFCVLARQRGFRVWADIETHVIHPSR